MPNNNIEISEIGGLITTNDDLLNRVIRQAEREEGATIAAAIPAITFEDDPSEKFYIVLLNFYEDDIRDWHVKQGRQEVYDYLKFLIKEEQIDPNTSFIMACDTISNEMNKEDVKPSTKPITVFRFMKVMFEEGKVLDDKEGFDIDEFDPVDYEHGDKTIIEA